MSAAQELPSAWHPVHVSQIELHGPSMRQPCNGCGGHVKLLAAVHAWPPGAGRTSPGSSVPPQAPLLLAELELLLELLELLLEPELLVELELLLEPELLVELELLLEPEVLVELELLLEPELVLVELELLFAAPPLPPDSPPSTSL